MSADRGPLGVLGCVSDPAHTGRCRHADGTSGLSVAQPPHPSCPGCLDRDELIYRLAQRAEKAEAALRHLAAATDQLRQVADWLDQTETDHSAPIPGQLSLLETP